MGPEASELRRQLRMAVEGTGAREIAVESLLECRVLAVTWPNTPDAVRTLTNGDGEQAMPLFSGREELQRAAGRFGWVNPDGSLSTRTLAARDALASALMQGVDFVVVDVCEAHALELSRDEVEQALRPGGPKPRHPPVQRQLRPSEPTAPIAVTPLSAPSVPIRPRFASRRREPQGLGDIDAPFAQGGGRSSLVAVEEVVRSRLRRDPRVDPSGPVSRASRAPLRQRVREGEGEHAKEPATVPLRPSAKRRSSGRASAPSASAQGEAARARSLVPVRGASVESSPRADAARARSLAPARETEAKAEPRAEAARPRSVVPRVPAEADAEPRLEAARPRSVVPRAPAEAPPEPPSKHGFPAVLPPSLPSLPDLSTLDAPPRPIAAPTLHEASAALPSFDTAPMPRPALDMSGALATPEANPAALEAAAMVAQVGKLASDPATQQAAAEVAAMLKDMAQKGKVDETQAAAQGMVKTLAGLFAAELQREGKHAQPARAESVSPPKADGAGAVAASSTASTAPAAPLEDAVLDAVADALRKFPEVEWACQITDASGAPSIAMRIEPSFMTRVDEIKAAVAKAGQAHGQQIGCTMLTDPQRMRDARAQGQVFFPWKKRGKKAT